MSSFANAIGGDLIYGIVEAREDGRPTGVPDTIEGLSISNTDAETRRLENMLRDGIAPRLPSVQFQWVPGFPAGPVLIIRVTRSWSGPHMVTYQQHSRFYARNAGGKYPLDVFELRQAFLGSGSLSERAREFRSERLGRLLAGELPISLRGDRLVCVHFIPHAALAGGTDVDILLAANHRDHLQPLYSDFTGGLSFNLDGVLTFVPITSGSNRSYLQMFRNGILETVTSGLLPERDEHGVILPTLAFAKYLGAFLSRARRLMHLLNIEPPASLYVSLLGARGATLGVSQRLLLYGDHEPKLFDRDNLLLRELFLRDWDGEPEVLLRPLLDELWQAAGYARCFDYDDHGNWKPSKS